MTTFEKCCTIRRLLMNRTAEVMVYKSWSEGFATRQIRDTPAALEQMQGGAELSGINPADMTDSQLEDLGFCRWCDETPMRLIPLWLYPFLAESLAVECVDGGTKVLKKSEMDTDNRFGCLAYGVTPSDR